MRLFMSRPGAPTGDGQRPGRASGHDEAAWRIGQWIPAVLRAADAWRCAAMPSGAITVSPQMRAYVTSSPADGRFVRRRCIR